MRSKRTAGKAALFKATSLLALGEFQEARLFLEHLPEEKRPEPATFYFLTAHAASGLKQLSVAAKALWACFEIEPAYAQEAREIPLLRDTLALMAAGAPSDARHAYS